MEWKSKSFFSAFESKSQRRSCCTISFHTKANLCHSRLLASIEKGYLIQEPLTCNTLAFFSDVQGLALVAMSSRPLNDAESPSGVDGTCSSPSPGGVGLKSPGAVGLKTRAGGAVLTLGLSGLNEGSVMGNGREKKGSFFSASSPFSLGNSTPAPEAAGGAARRRGANRLGFALAAAFMDVRSS